MRSCLFISLAAFLAGIFTLSSAQSLEYTFTPIATTEGPFSTFSGAAINDSGEVVFRAWLDSDPYSGFGQGIFVWKNGALTTVALNQVADPSSLFEGLNGSPVINNAGMVVFGAQAYTDDQNVEGGIYRWDGATVDILYDQTNTGFNYFYPGTTPSINNAGIIAFRGFNWDTDYGGIVKGNGGPLTVVADQISFGSFFEENTAINDSGVVAFFASPDFDYSNLGIYVGDGGPITTIADTSGQFSEVPFYTVAINNNNVVAFHANLDTGELGKFIHANGITTKVVDDSGPFQFYFRVGSRGTIGYGGLAINDSGAVVFDAAFDDEPYNSGIFTGPDPVADKVIQVGDMLNGHVVGGRIILPGSETLNNASQFVFKEIYNGDGTEEQDYETLYLATPIPTATGLAASVLPSSRSVQIGSPASAFATMINSTTQAMDCGIAPQTYAPADFAYQTTDPTTNALTGTPNTPVDIAAGGVQSYVFTFTPTAEILPTDVLLAFDCTNKDPAPVVSGLNTFLLSASSSPVSDIVSMATTPSGDGIVNLASTGVFAVASVNVGSSDTLTVSADTGDATLPVSIALCETNPTTGACINPPAPTSGSVITTIAANATPTFGLFVTSTDTVPFDPANKRIFVYFRDALEATRGSTSVAVRTVSE